MSLAAEDEEGIRPRRGRRAGVRRLLVVAPAAAELDQEDDDPEHDHGEDDGGPTARLEARGRVT